MKKAAEKTDKITFVVAKEDNGNVQITFTIPFTEVKKAQDETIKEFAKDMEVAGFRKGKAPLSKVAEKVSQSQLIEHSLAHILPVALAEAINSNKLKIAIYPKYELISAKDNENWQIRAVTCELPEVNLGSYKDAVKGALRAGSIIVPGKNEKTELTREQKEQTAIKSLLEAVKLNIPKILIEEEVSSRLSNLLSRIEKLGLDLDRYLTSIGKTADSLRTEYESQASDAISVDLILSKIALTENLSVAPKEVEEALKMSESAKSDQKEKETGRELEDRKRLLESILRRRLALDFLLNLS